LAVANKYKTTAKIIAQLRGKYGKKPRPPSWETVEMLLFYLVYYHSGVTAARRVVKALREEYIDLNEVRVSSLNEIRGSLGKSGAEESLASQLRTVLKDIFMRENFVSLATIDALPPDQVKRYMSRLESVPGHAVDYLLLVQRNFPVLPVDKQVAVMAARLGLVTAGAGEAQAQKALMRKVDAKSYFEFYSLCLEHATKICGSEPRCAQCILRRQCKYGKSASRRKK
jgi:endonuclease III